MQMSPEHKRQKIQNYIGFTHNSASWSWKRCVKLPLRSTRCFWTYRFPASLISPHATEEGSERWVDAWPGSVQAWGAFLDCHPPLWDMRWCVTARPVLRWEYKKGISKGGKTPCHLARAGIMERALHLNVGTKYSLVFTAVLPSASLTLQGKDARWLLCFYVIYSLSKAEWVYYT